MATIVGRKIRKPRTAVGKLETAPLAATDSAEMDAFRQGRGQGQEPKAKGISAETRIVELAVDTIHRRPSNRGGVAISPPEVADLVASIEEFGLSVPIEVRPRSEEQQLPAGHYELVKGERRWTAFRCLGLDTIPAIVRDTDEATAAVDVAIDNTQHVGLNPIQRAMAIRDAILHGVPEERAGKMYGLASESGRKNALRLLDLPAKVKAAVSDGRLAERNARYLVPYTQVAGVMKAVEQSLSAKGNGQLWWLEGGRDEEQVKHGVRRLVESLTRPVDGKTKHDYGWQEGQHPCYFRKSIDETLRKELGVIEIRVDNRPLEVATNVERFDELNREQMAKRKETQKAKQMAGNPDAAGASKESNQSQDARLASKVAIWRHRFLRQSIARALQPGCPWCDKVCLWVLTQSHENLNRWLIAIGERSGMLSDELDQVGCDDCLSWWGLINRMTPDDADPVSDLEWARCELARYLLWPVSSDPLAADACARDVLVGPGELPLRIPDLYFGEVEEVAEYLHRQEPSRETGFSAAWDRARRSGPERQMFMELLEYPNRRQLHAWCEEWGVWDLVRGWKRLTTQVEAVCELHGSEPLVAKGLRVPKWIPKWSARW